MTLQQVGDMFSEAQRMDNKNEFLKRVQGGLYSRSDPRSLSKKNPEKNVEMVMSPRAWKTVTKSSFALKSKFLNSDLDHSVALKKDLKQFRDEITAKRQ